MAGCSMGAAWEFTGSARRISTASVAEEAGTTALSAAGGILTGMALATGMSPSFSDSVPGLTER